MSDKQNSDTKKPLTLNRPKLELKKPLSGTQVRQSFSHGRSKTVQVEVKRKRVILPGEDTKALSAEVETAELPAPVETKPQSPVVKYEEAVKKLEAEAHKLTDKERQARMKALEEEAKRRAEEDIRLREEEEARKLAAEAAKREVQEEAQPAEGQEWETAVEQTPASGPEQEKAAPTPAPVKKRSTGAHDDEHPDQKNKKAAVKLPTPGRSKGEPKRRQGKLTVTRALEEGEETTRTRSMASMRRQREREKRKEHQFQMPTQKVIREVVVPEAITVQELANRMAERGGEVVKTLMKLGIMATINQVIDADTAELVVSEFGHRIKRVSEEDVEIGVKGAEDKAEDLVTRAPVVTVMGHVDHGKTTLLDALRGSDVAGHEAGGITQHIGAFQVKLKSGQQITFLDTPGHAAFSEMRSRGANVTDIVVLVVAADDGIMAQTQEAINHAKAAEVPIIVAINKIDKPGADPDKVKTALFSYGLAAEDMGGDIMCIPVSAKTREGMESLEESIVLQSEIMELKANPKRRAEGTIVEAKLEQGRGSVATALIQTGTIRVGDVFVAGCEYGKVRALLNDRGERIQEAFPSMPVEILGLNGTPVAGDELAVVDSESRAREIADYRSERKRKLELAASGRSTLEQMLSKIKEGEAKTLPVVIKSDVHGSLEAITGALGELGNEEVKVDVLHAGVGGVNESDVTLARASGAMIIAFNVRANAQAREVAKRDAVDIRYYAIIYNVIDDIKAALSGMLSPEQREKIMGYAEIREVFAVSKVGKVAGCKITEGLVKRGARVRLLRDDIVIHDGTLKTLRRFKDEVREVREGFECGMAFENYHDIQAGDRIECYEIEEIARQL